MAQTLLLIDDDDLTRSMLGMLLEEDGWQVIEAEDGESALALLKAGNKPDAVLTDLQMPGLAGAELAIALREACGEGIPLLAMTATIKGDVAGFDRLLQKPVDAAMVRAALAGEQAKSAASEADGDLSEAIYAKMVVTMAAGQVAALYDFALNDAEMRVERMRASVEIAEDTEFRKEAHALKGSASMVGALRMQTLASSLEAAGISLETSAALDEIMASITHLRSILAVRTSSS